MAQRLVVVAHGRVGSALDPLFGDQGPLIERAELGRAELGRAEVGPVSGRIQGWVRGPETACGQTAELLGARGRIEPGLAGPDHGRWTGRSLSEVMAEDLAGVQRWLRDPQAAPPGGESLEAALSRIGQTCDTTVWPDGRTVLVVTPVVARLVALHALGGAAGLGFRLDVRFGGRFELSRAGGGWRLLLG